MNPIHLAILLKSQVQKYRQAIASESVIQQEQALVAIQEQASDALRELRQTRLEKYSTGLAVEVARRAQM